MHGKTGLILVQSVMCLYGNRKQATALRSKKQCMPLNRIDGALTRQFIAYYRCVNATVFPLCIPLVESNATLTISSSEYYDLEHTLCPLLQHYVKLELIDTKLPDVCNQLLLYPQQIKVIKN